MVKILYILFYCNNYSIFLFSVCFLCLSFPLPLPFSISAALQVSISLNKVELSVGESKFFICTGTNATHYHFYVDVLYV